MSPFLFAIASAMSFPLWRICFLISMFCFAKNPFWMPRSSGSAFAIGSESTVIVSASCLLGAPLAAPPNATSAQSALAIATPTHLARRWRVRMCNGTLLLE